ncbi:MAG: FG-GAP repeat protein, partial [Synechococcales cyanobacterium K32_A2020_035]|nr:FG-GAP repeat protein [Synechococcales cyanobacterium K32_A2020_035]
MSFDPILNLSSLDGSNGFRLDGAAAFDRSGNSVSSAGDVNGDGFDDLIIGAGLANNNDSGSSYVVFGKASGFNATQNLSTLDGSNGFRLDGVAAFDNSGVSVSSAGDVNGDGVDDLIIGAFRADNNGGDSGSSYVVFGKASGFSATQNLSTLDGSNGFRLDGVAAFDRSGGSVSSAGDVNGDGFDDLIIGVNGADPNGDYSGSSYVVFGKASGFNATQNLSTLDGSNGFRLDGVAAFDNSGVSVSSAGDVNGDGVDDLIIGAFRADNNGGDSGSSYVVFGKASGFSATQNLS